MRTDLPAEFIERMRGMLGEDYAAFEASYEFPRRRGLRVNTMRISEEDFEKLAPFPLRRLPWIRTGFTFEDSLSPAGHPFYAAGLYYLQEPSAMTPADRLPIERGDRVLDLCAAPGGKATALAARLAGSGILVANDISTARARALLRNLELFGTGNAYVTNETPERLAEAFPSYFDKILVDAPCSGEGMFRKNPEAAREWSPEKVVTLAAQQKRILAEALSMLKPGGMLLYSTCTFSAEENEQVIRWVLDTYPDMELCRPEGYEGFDRGRPDWAGGDPRLSLCVRIWPHRMEGEGHFMALLSKAGGEPARPEGLSDHVVPLEFGIEQREKKRKKQKKGQRTGAAAFSGGIDREKQTYLDSFFEAVTGLSADAALRKKKAGEEESGEESGGQVECRGERAFLVPHLPETGRGLSFLRKGLYVGDWKKNRFEPSQPLALYLDPDRVSRKLCLPAEDERIVSYLRGDQITLTEEEADRLGPGWLLVCAGRFGLGWAKLTGRILKNKYPAAWR